MMFALAFPAAGAAQGPLGPPVNDLFAIGQGGGQTPDTLPVMQREEPPFVATPQGPCLPGSKPEPGIQGRVPAGSATAGLWGNLPMSPHQGKTGGLKTLRYVAPTAPEAP